ncbi:MULTISPECIES: hypothetical protein [Flavobacterium]|uniref:hypothetical protein n=1 Tax=Flavobacterium TaxID=237 RepID=UPI001183574A|nr:MULTISPECIES: hypothetical protein [Flavobacterium]MCR4029226.1 hypothetical protein [Flavobacterium panacis]
MIKKIKNILAILLFMSFGVIHAHKDRIERPKSFVFVLSSKKAIRFNSNDSKLEKFCDEVISGKQKILGAKLFYETGEVVTIVTKGKKWNLLRITFNEKSIDVPQKILNKIPEIRFQTLNLLWSGESNAFDSSYCYLEFEIGVKQMFGEFPSLHLFFENMRFSKSEIYFKISEDSTQIKNF